MRLSVGIAAIPKFGVLPFPWEGKFRVQIFLIRFDWTKIKNPIGNQNKWLQVMWIRLLSYKILTKILETKQVGDIIKSTDI